MKLLLHLGSSTILYAICSDEKIIECNYVEIDNFNENVIIEYIMRNAKNIKSIYYSSVSELFTSFLNEIEEILNMKWIRITAEDVQLDFKNEDMKNEIGIDLLLGLWKISTIDSSGVLIDFGQLTKIYLLENNIIMGGVLLPSTKLQIRSIIQNVNRIQAFRSEEATTPMIGENNNQALTIGVIYGQMFVVNQVVKKYLENGFSRTVFVTGGLFNDKLLRENLAFDYIFDLECVVEAMFNLINGKKLESRKGK